MEKIHAFNHSLTHPANLICREPKFSLQNVAIVFCKWTRDLHGTGYFVPEPVPFLLLSFPFPSRSRSGQSCSHPAPVASTPGPVPVLLKPVGEKNEIENFIHTVHITRWYGHRQLWTKYVVHIMLHKKRDKYSDNGKYRPNSSNNGPTMEPGVTPSPAGGERLLLPVTRDTRSSQSHPWHSRGMKSGHSSDSRSTPVVFPQDFTTSAPVQNSKSERQLESCT